ARPARPSTESTTTPARPGPDEVTAPERHATARQDADGGERPAPAAPRDGRPSELTDLQVALVRKRMRELTERPISEEEVRAAYREWLPLRRPVLNSDRLAYELSHYAVSGELPGLRGGGMGLEGELHNIGISLPRGYTTNDFETIVDAPEFSIVLDDGHSGPVLEIVSKPFAVVDGDLGRPSAEQVHRAVQDAVRRLRNARDRTRLERVFDDDRFDVDPDAGEFPIRKYSQHNQDEIYAHYSAGVPLAGLPRFMRYISDSMRTGGFNSAARQQLRDGMSLARRISDEAAEANGFSRFERKELEGFLALTYTQFAAIAERHYAGTGMGKNYAALNSRVEIWEARRALSQDVRRYLDGASRDLAARFAGNFRSGVVNANPGVALLQERVPPRVRNARSSGRTLGDYLDGAFSSRPAHRVSQYDALVIRTTMGMDHNYSGGVPLLDPPALVAELRVQGSSRESPNGLQRTAEDIARHVRSSYREAQELRQEDAAGNSPTGSGGADGGPPDYGGGYGSGYGDGYSTPAPPPSGDSYGFGAYSGRYVGQDYYSAPAPQPSTYSQAPITTPSYQEPVHTSSHRRHRRRHRDRDYYYEETPTTYPSSSHTVYESSYGQPAIAPNPYRNTGSSDYYGSQGYYSQYPSAPARPENEPGGTGPLSRDDRSPFAVDPREWENFRSSIPGVERGRTAGIHHAELAAFRDPDVDLRSALDDVAARRTEPRAPVLDSRFQVRRMNHDGDQVAEVTLRVALSAGRDATPGDLAAAWSSAVDGIHDVVNRPGAKFRTGPVGDRLFVRLEQVEPGRDADVSVVVGEGHRGLSNARQWRSDIRPREAAHELMHALGIPDEHNAGHGPQVQLDVPGSLMGDFYSPAERGTTAEGLSEGGLRPRYLDLLGAAIGDDVPTTTFRNDLPDPAPGSTPDAPPPNRDEGSSGPNRDDDAPASNRDDDASAPDRGDRSSRPNRDDDAPAPNRGDESPARRPDDEDEPAPQPSMPRRRPAPAPVMLQGRHRREDGTTVTVEFTPNAVESRILGDADGRPIGVCFPTLGGDADMFRSFTRNFNGRVTRTLPGEMTLVPGPANRDGSQVRPPWQRDADRRGRPRTPTFIFIHTNNDRYGVTIPIDGISTVISVSQETVAYLLDKNPEFQYIMERNEKSPLVFAACDAGNAGNSTRIVSGLRSGYSAGHDLSRRYDNSLYFGYNEVAVTRTGYIGVAENGGWLRYDRGSTTPRMDADTIYTPQQVSAINRNESAANVPADNTRTTLDDYGNNYGNNAVGSGYGRDYVGSTTRQVPIPAVDPGWDWSGPPQPSSSQDYYSTTTTYPPASSHQSSYDRGGSQNYSYPYTYDTSGASTSTAPPPDPYNSTYGLPAIEPNPYREQAPYDGYDSYGRGYYRSRR
ncbi:hypothetical protein LCD35_28585, partial [Saccharopolyspora sp. 6V]|nr:hypothetical protein [Saccharopolyspora sp. 6V]